MPRSQLIFWGVCSVLLIFGWGVWQWQGWTVLPVKEVTCQTDRGDCPDYVQAELNSYLGQSLFFTDFAALATRITQYAPFLTSYQIQKRYPDQVLITFQHAQASYRYQDQDGQIWLIDQAGYFISLAEDSNQLPLVRISRQVGLPSGPGERLAEELHTQLQTTLQLLQQPNLTGSRFILLNQQEGVVILPNQQLAIFTLSNAPAELTKLNYLLRQFAFDDLKQPIREIDLRFNQVVLRQNLTINEVSDGGTVP